MDITQPILLVPLLMLSLIAGSFLGVVVDRVPAKVSIIRPRSHCTACGTFLQMRDLIPLLGFALLRGRCRACHAQIPHALPLIELASLGVMLWALAVVPPEMLPATVLLGWILLALAITDARHFILPDLLTFPLVLAGLATCFLTGSMDWPEHVAGAVVGAAFFAIVRWVFFRVRGREGLGLGDVKLFGAAGAWLGVEGLPNVLLIASISGLVFASMRDGRLEFGRAIPFGSCLCLGIWLTWLYGPIELLP